MSLAPAVRKQVALRLLKSVDPAEAFDSAAESWLRTEAAVAYDKLRADPSRAIPAEAVRAHFQAKWAARYMTGRIDFTPERRSQVRGLV